MSSGRGMHVANVLIVKREMTHTKSKNTMPNPANFTTDLYSWLEVPITIRHSRLINELPRSKSTRCRSRNSISTHLAEFAYLPAGLGLLLLRSVKGAIGGSTFGATNRG